MSNNTSDLIKGHIICLKKTFPQASYEEITNKLTEMGIVVSKTTVFNIWDRFLKNQLESRRFNCGRHKKMIME